MARADTNGTALIPTSTATKDAAWEDAVAWFVRLRDTALSDQDRKAFAAWLAQCPSHAAAMADIGRLWRGLDSLPRPSASMKIAQPAFGLNRRHILAGFGLASLAAAGAWQMRGGSALVAPVGGHLPVAFGTQAQLTLDSHSAIDIVSGEPNPKAELRRGQIFAVADRPRGQPIAIEVPYGMVAAEVAVFNLKLERRRAILAVESGRVALQTMRGDRLDLGPLQEIAFGDRLAEPVRPIGLSRVAPWRESHLVFDRTRLVDVIDDLNRYRPGRLILGDPRLDDLLITGMFETSRPGAALDTVLAAFSLRTLNFGDALTVLFSA